MRFFHCIVVKILFRRPRNWDKVDGCDLYQMWVLLKSDQCDWVKFNLNRIEYCRTSPKRSLCITSFIQFILDFNGISFVDEDLVEVLKPVECYQVDAVF